jgi:hypothetical protein
MAELAIVVPCSFSGVRSNPGCPKVKIRALALALALAAPALAPWGCCYALLLTPGWCLVCRTAQCVVCTAPVSGFLGCG